jgi:hypothetical protein
MPTCQWVHAIPTAMGRSPLAPITVEHVARSHHAVGFRSTNQDWMDMTSGRLNFPRAAIFLSDRCSLTWPRCDLSELAEQRDVVCLGREEGSVLPHQQPPEVPQSF